VTTTGDCGVNKRGRKMVACGLCSWRRKLPHVASYIAIRAGALEMADCYIQGALEVYTI